MRWIFIGFALALSCSGAESLSQSERALILLHQQTSAAPSGDSSNRGSGNAYARAAGQMLFRERALSADASMACTTCHVPEKWFADGIPRAMGRKPLARNTPTVVDVGYHRWYGWGGAHDNLWSASIRALTAPTEMAASAEHVAHYVQSVAEIECALERAFDVQLKDLSAESILVLVGKALAAYQESLVSGPSPFDRFVDSLRRDDRALAAEYPHRALEGAKLFIGKGRCHFCHAGPNFSNGEFADAAVPYFTANGVDKGRYADLQRLRESPFSRLGEYSDDSNSARANLTRFAAQRPEQFGSFRVPSLRNVAMTPPYMHDGSLATLDDVIEHYSTLDTDRLHANTAQLLRPLQLADNEHAALKAFLLTLTGTPPPDVPQSSVLFECQ